MKQEQSGRAPQGRVTVADRREGMMEIGAQAQEEQNRRLDRIWMGRAARLFCLAVAIAGGYLLLTRALPSVLPFLVAWLLSIPVRCGAERMERKIGLPRRVGAVILVLLVLVIVISSAVLLGERLIYEAQRLLSSMGGGEQVMAQIEEVIDFFTRITAHIPPLEGLLEQQSLESFWRQVDATVAALVSDTLTRWSAKIPDAVGAFLRALPSALIFLLTFLIAVFYCCADDGSVSTFFHDAIPPLWRPKVQTFRRRLADVGMRYLRAYFLLFLLTFLQLFIGFSILGLPYIFLPALLIALVDILPVLGVGTVLIPWGLICLWRGDMFIGTGLLIIFAVMLLIRQILEPRILGGSLGLHPLATLVAVYAGLQLGGILGMIVAPAIALLIKSMLTKEEEGAVTRKQ